MRCIAILALFMLCGCKSLTVMCVEQSQAQYNTAIKQYGTENVQIWRLKNATPYPYVYHAQTRVRIDGQWYWLPNRPYTEYFQTKPQTGCTPYERMK